MAATTLVGVMDGVATRLATITGLNVNTDVKDDGYPLAIISLPDINYHGSFAHGIIRVDLTVTILTAKGIDQAGIRQLAVFADVAGTSSVHAVIEADKSLGGAVDNCVVLDFRPLNGGDEYGRLGFVGGIFTLRVSGKGA